MNLAATSADNLQMDRFRDPWHAHRLVYIFVSVGPRWVCFVYPFCILQAIHCAILERSFDGRNDQFGPMDCIWNVPGACLAKLCQLATAAKIRRLGWRCLSPWLKIRHEIFEKT